VNSSAPGCSVFPLFNGKLRDECPNVEVFFSLADARKKLALWREDYNQHRPHSALDDRTPAEFAASWVDHAKAGLPQAVCLRHSRKLQYVQICPSLRAEPNHAGRNLQPPAAQLSGAGHLRENSGFIW
jgi:hypothetical protein